jgi:hypothetical protein
MAENVEKSIENIVKELRRLQDCELQVAEALRKHGLTLVKTAAGYDVLKLGEITAQSQKKSPGQSDQIHCRHRLENNGVCPQHNLQCGWPKCNEPEDPRLTGLMLDNWRKADQPQQGIRVYGWVWKDKQTEDDCYIPSYTPAQHVPRGELFALVDPADLHEPLQNTKWF